MQTLVTTCSECINTATYWENDTTPYCEWCYHAKDCKPPKKIRFYSAHLSGEYRAGCRKCNFVSAYWECGCDLFHDCEGAK